MRKGGGSLTIKLAYELDWNDGRMRVEADTLPELNEVVKQLRTYDNRKPIQNEKNNGSYPSLLGNPGCSDAIRTLIASDWGRAEPRTEAELTEAMRASAIHYPHGTISGVLNSLTRRGQLRRVGKKKGSYAYTIGQVENDKGSQGT